MESLLRNRKFGIRGIWAVDSPQQVASGVLNERTQGDDSMNASLREDEISIGITIAQLLSSTIQGIYSSWLMTLRIRCPIRLLGSPTVWAALNCTSCPPVPPFNSALVLIEPAILNRHPSETILAFKSTSRKAQWPSREAAEPTFRKNNFFQAWDSKVPDRYLHFGLRQVPTARSLP